MKTNFPKSTKMITFVIHPTQYDYDILAIGDISLLRKIRKYYPFSHLIKKSKFGGIPILVIDTVDTLRGVKSLIENYRVLCGKEGER